MPINKLKIQNVNFYVIWIGNLFNATKKQTLISKLYTLINE